MRPYVSIMQQPKPTPQPDVAGAPTHAGPGTLHVPQTRAEFDALVARREELKSQLHSVAEHRRELFQQSLLASDASAKRELNARITALDQRSARLEEQVLAADDAIAAAAGRGIPGPQTDPWSVIRQISTAPPRRQVNTEMIASVMFGEALVFVLIGVVLWHTLWKRSLAKLRTTFAGADSSARLDQLQRAVDVIAVEVERISENQRYVTKMLSDKLQPALGAGEAQQFATSRKVAEPARVPDEG